MIRDKAPAISTQPQTQNPELEQASVLALDARVALGGVHKNILKLREDITEKRVENAEKRERFTNYLSALALSEVERTEAPDAIEDTSWRQRRQMMRVERRARKLGIKRVKENWSEALYNNTVHHSPTKAAKEKHRIKKEARTRLKNGEIDAREAHLIITGTKKLTYGDANHYQHKRHSAVSRSEKRVLRAGNLPKRNAILRKSDVGALEDRQQQLQDKISDKQDQILNHKQDREEVIAAKSNLKLIKDQDKLAERSMASFADRLRGTSWMDGDTMYAISGRNKASGDIEVQIINADGTRHVDDVPERYIFEYVEDHGSNLNP